MRGRLTVIAVVLASVVPACGGSGGDSGSSATTLRPGPGRQMEVADDGFSFLNFSSSATTELLDTGDMVEMFGDGVCSPESGDTCVLIAEAAAWAQMVNDSRVFGHCEGMAVVSADRFIDSVSPKTGTLLNEGQVTHAIIRAFSSQFLPEVIEATGELRDLPMGEKVDLLEAALATGSLEYSIGVYNDSGGHALLPYRIERISDSKLVIHVYDSNWPRVDRVVEVDLDTERWAFSFSGSDIASDPAVWTGGTDDFDLTPMSSRVAGDAPFDGVAGVRGSYLVVKSALPDWSITAGRLRIDATSADVVPVRAGLGPTSFLVPTPDEGFSLTLPSAASAYSVGGDSIVHIVTDGATSPVNITPGRVDTTSGEFVVSVAADDLATTIENVPASIEVVDETLVARIEGRVEPLVVSAENSRLTVSVVDGAITETDGSTIASVEPPTLPAAITQDVTRFEVVTASSAPEPTTTPPTASTTSSTTSTTKPPPPPSSPTSAPTPTTATPPSAPRPLESTVASIEVLWQPNPPNIPMGGPMASIPIRLLNPYGETVTVDSITLVTVAVVSNGGAGATLSGTTARVVNAGTTRFEGLGISGAPGQYFLDFTAVVNGVTVKGRSINFTLN